MKFQKPEFFNLQPILLWEGHYRMFNRPFWVHPFWETYLTEKDDCDLYQNLYVIQLGELSCAFVSQTVDYIFEQYHEKVNFEDPNWKKILWSDYLDIENLTMCVSVLLTEDVWCPIDANHTKMEEQFCFTEAGEKVSELIGDFRYFTPDCGFWKDGDEWGYDT